MIRAKRSCLYGMMGDGRTYDRICALRAVTFGLWARTDDRGIDITGSARASVSGAP